MISRAYSLKGTCHTPPRYFANVLRRQILSLENNSLRYHIPRMRHLYEQHEKMPYHFEPELFIQLGGITEFSFPGQRLSLLPGEVCVVPKGMPHGECVRNEHGRFENVVVSFYNKQIDIHLAHEVFDGCPRADSVLLMKTELYSDLIFCMERICALHHDNHRDAGQPGVASAGIRNVIKGLFLVGFSLLQALVETPGVCRPATTDSVALCTWLIQHNLQLETLSLKTLADEIGCSPNHLSKLFHRATGEQIVKRITRLRLQRAVDALRHTRLSVKQIAAGCGFGDANYFARVFSQHTGCAPLRYRKEHAVAPDASALIARTPHRAFFPDVD